MATKDFKRKLSAIFSADVKGYSRLMAENEAETVETITAYREIMGILIKQHRGRMVDSPGDNVLAEFASVVDAVQCAVAVQKEFKARNTELPDDRRMEFRIGVNLGDVIEEEDRIYGDGVNIAARLEALAEPGGICISKTAFDQIETKLPLGYEYLGEQHVKNIPKPVGAYRVLMEPRVTMAEEIAKEKAVPSWRRKAILVGGVAFVVVVLAALIWNFYFRPAPIEPASVERMAYPLPDKPSVAVLPFANMSGDPGQDYLSDGITENIITALSKTPKMFVIASNSVFAYKGKPVSVKQVAEDLGVRYVLEGSVQRSEDRLRIMAQLIDAVKGHHLWADRYDREMPDLFELQDEITIKILAAMEVELTEGEQARAHAKGTDNLDAYLKDLEARELMRKMNKNSNAAGRRLAQEAIALDPQYPSPYVGLSFSHLLDIMYGWSDSPKKSFAQAGQMAQKALSLDDTLDMAHALMGRIYCFKRQYDKAISEGKKSLVLGPNSTFNMSVLAGTYLFAGEPEKAVDLYERAVRLDPSRPLGYVTPLGNAYLHARRYEDAIATYKEVLQWNPNYPQVRPALASAYQLAGLEEDARTTVEEHLKKSPNSCVERSKATLKKYPFKSLTQYEFIIEALRKAGLPETPPLSLPDKPSIAVLPFVNMSEDPKQEYFSDGITDDLITGLSKISGLFVIARNSVFAYKGKTAKMERVSRELGIRYVLQGSVRKAGDRIRITAQLVDVNTGGHLWAEKYDRDLKDIFALQDEVTQKIVTALAVKLTEDEQESLVRKGTDNVEAYDYTLRGGEYFFRFTKGANAQARQMFETAINVDPEYASAHSWLGWTHWIEWSFGWSQDPQSLEQAFELAQMAIALDDSLPEAHRLLGSVYLWKKRHEQAIAVFEKSIALNPNHADAIRGLGETLYFAGKPEEAIGLIKRAMRLNPKYPVWYLLNLGHAYFLTGRYEESIAALKRALIRNPHVWPAHVYLAANYIALGKEKEARAEAAEIVRINPNFSLETMRQRLPYKDQAVLARLFDGLRKAGLK